MCSDVWCLRLKTKVLPREEPSSARVEGEVGYCSRRSSSSMGSCGRKVKRFFRGFQRKKGKKFLLLDPAEEGSASSSAGSSERTMSSTDPAEEPAKPSSVGNISWSRKNLQNLLPQATYLSRGRTCETSFVEHVFLFFGFFS